MKFLPLTRGAGKITFLFAILFAQGCEAIQLSVGSVSNGCSDGASNVVVDSFSATCGDNACGFGEEVTVTGTVTYKGLSSSDAYVSVLATKGWLQRSLFSEYEVDLCNGVESTSGSECPEDGTYTIGASTFTIPEQGGSYWFASGLSIGVQVVFSDGSSQIGCASTTVSATRSMSQSWYASYSSLVTISGLVLFVSGIGVAALRRKKRKAAVLDLNDKKQHLAPNKEQPSVSV